MYRLAVPPDVPAKQYWSVVVYDRATHAFIRNLPRQGRSSERPELQRTPNGMIDIYFGPEAPIGKESNWIPTSASGQFEVCMRLYGPDTPLFDNTWKLPDIEKIS